MYIYIVQKVMKVEEIISSRELRNRIKQYDKEYNFFQILGAIGSGSRDGIIETYSFNKTVKRVI